jgi:glycosyltransferase involved in cell wall biosynthesis/SAM-dependent methyltransferase
VGAVSEADGPMDLGLVYTRCWPAVGGAETQLAALASDLAARGHRVRLLAPIHDQGPATPLRLGVMAPAVAPRTVDGVELLGLSPTLLERLAALPTLVYYAPRLRRWFYHPLLELGIRSYRAVFAGRIARALEGVCAIYCVALNHLGWAAYEAARRLDVPFVIKPLAHPGQYGDDAVNLDLVRRADAVIALHDEEKRFYAARGVDPQKILVIGIAPLLSETADPAGFRERHGIPGPLVAFIGRQCGYKGLPHTARAVRSLWDRFPDLRLAIAGPAEEPPDLPADGRILDLGHVDEATKTSLLAAADVLCLPSRHEVLPGVVLEAWSLGKPVIAGDIPYLRALVADGVDGLLVPQDEEAIAGAIARLVSDPQLAARMGAAGSRKVSERHSRTAVARATEELLHGLARAGRGAATARLEAEREFHDAYYRSRASDGGPGPPGGGGGSGSSEEAAASPPPLDRFAGDAVCRLGAVAGTRVLDCGTGEGELALELAARGATVFSVDVSGESLRLARRALAAAGLAGRARLVQAAVEALPFPSGSMDRVAGSLILHHADVDRAAGEIARVLRPGGRAAFSENFGANPILNFARAHLAGRFGIPRLGTATERPLTAADLAALRSHLDVETAWPEFLFFRLLDRQVFRYRWAAVRWVCRTLDSLVHRFCPGLHRFSYRGTLILARPEPPGSAGSLRREPVRDRCI